MHHELAMIFALSTSLFLAAVVFQQVQGRATPQILNCHCYAEFEGKIRHPDEIIPLLGPDAKDIAENLKQICSTGKEPNTCRVIEDDTRVPLCTSLAIDGAALRACYYVLKDMVETNELDRLAATETANGTHFINEDAARGDFIDFCTADFCNDTPAAKKSKP